MQAETSLSVQVCKCASKLGSSNRETTEKDEMSKQEFIKMFKAHGIEVSTREEAGWALQFLNEKAPTGYRPKDIYLAWKADA